MVIVRLFPVRFDKVCCKTAIYRGFDSFFCISELNIVTCSLILFNERQ